MFRWQTSSLTTISLTRRFTDNLSDECICRRCCDLVILLAKCLVSELVSELWCLSGGKKEDYQNCSALYRVLKLCTVISILRWAVLTVLCIGFCHTRPISLCINLFVFICVYFVSVFHTAYVLYYCEQGEVDLMGLKHNP